VSLVACPFCRELSPAGEKEECPVCGMKLRDLAKLPLSFEADQDGAPRAPEVEPLPVTYLGRGKGALTAMAFAGLALFFLPWIHLTLPDTVDLSGFDLARKLGWSWGAGVAWTVLVPTVMSRRTILQLRGARVAAAFLALVPAVTVGILRAMPPRGGIVPLRFTFGWPIYATFAVSLVAFAWALFRLGGRLDDIRVGRGNSSGHVLH